MNLFILIGVILLLVGLVLAFVPINHPHAPAPGLAYFLIVLGIVLILIGVLVGADLGDGHNALMFGAPLMFVSRLISRRRRANARRGAATIRLF